MKPELEKFYEEMVGSLAKPGADILASLTPEDCHLWHMASCIPGEAGELFDAVKKAVIYRKPLDRKNVVEELGDLEFYMEGLRAGLGITREEVLEANVAKLSKRYGKTYSDAAAQARADKAKEEAAPVAPVDPRNVGKARCVHPTCPHELACSNHHEGCLFQRAADAEDGAAE